MLVFLLLAAAAPAAAQPCDPAGDWDGALTVPAGIQLPLILHLDGGASTIDSPDQNATDIPIEVQVQSAGVTVVMPSTKAEFAGTFSPDCQTLAGPFRQNGVEMKARFARRQAGEVAPGRDRPQTPKPPFPYQSREVSFADGPVTLAGTLTTPPGVGPFPAVVMIAGSGPQNRDETVAGHRIFLVIADALTRKGIAVLRYDKRGVGQSTGNYVTATQKDFLNDARAALDWLRRQPGIIPAKTGLLGHSEGAVIAPALAGSDGGVAFTVLLSAPAETGAETIASQANAIALASGVPPKTAAANDALQRRLLAAVKAAPDGDSAKKVAIAILSKAGIRPEIAARQAEEVASPWYRAFIGDDPLPALGMLAGPTLVIAGSKDLQVLPSRNVPLIRKALAGNPDARIVELPGLNHLLQPAATGLPTEYGQISTTIDPQVLDLITSWIVDTTR